MCGLYMWLCSCTEKAYHAWMSIENTQTGLLTKSLLTTHSKQQHWGTSEHRQSTWKTPQRWTEREWLQCNDEHAACNGPGFPTLPPCSGARSRALRRAGLLAAPLERWIMTPSTVRLSVPTSRCTKWASMAKRRPFRACSEGV